MTSKRLRKLRKEYQPRAAAQRLRLTDKRIRALEKERLHRGKSFEAFYRKYQRERIHHSETHLIAKYSLTRRGAKELRKAAIKQHLSIKKVLPIDFGAPIIPKPGQMEFTSNWVDFRAKIVEMVKQQQKLIEIDANFVLKVAFGELEYEGSLLNFPHVQFRSFGDELYGLDDSPPWVMWMGLVEGFTYYENRSGEIWKTRLEVVVDSKASGTKK